MKKINFATLLLTLLLSMMSTNTFAYDFEIDGIYYRMVNSKAVEVSSGDKSYSGDVVIPEKVTYEGEDYSVESIGEFSFNSCSGLTSVTIPNSVKKIGNYAYAYCGKLSSVTIGNSVTSIGNNAFYDCTGLTSVTIPNSVTSIGNYAFYDCTGLTSVTIPNSVTRIGGSAFANCSSLTSITIGKSVSFIGEYAFARSSKLEEVYCLSEKLPSAGTDAFNNSNPENATLFVPASAINEYKSTYPWRWFGTIKTIEGGEIPKCATPTISYGNKVLTFSCETEGVEYVYEIKDTDIKKGYVKEVNLSATYEISVYATKSGYENSNVATATLVWTRGTFTETTPDDPTSAKAMQIDTPVLISANNGLITVKGELDGEPVAVYTAEGKLMGSGTMSAGLATVSTSLEAGSVAIVKIGQKAVKVVMR